MIVNTTPTVLSHISGAIVPSQNFTFTGTAESGSVVTVSGTGFFYTGSTNNLGNWSIPVINFPIGTNYPTFTATDTVGNVSSGVTLTLIVNVLPTSPTITAPTGTINTKIPIYSGSG